MPLSKIKDGVTVWFLIEETTAAESVLSCSTRTKNAFNILMIDKNKTSIEEKQVKKQSWLTIQWCLKIVTAGKIW